MWTTLLLNQGWASCQSWWSGVSWKAPSCSVFSYDHRQLLMFSLVGQIKSCVSPTPNFCGQGMCHTPFALGLTSRSIPKPISLQGEWIHTCISRATLGAATQFTAEQMVISGSLLLSGLSPLSNNLGILTVLIFLSFLNKMLHSI